MKVLVADDDLDMLDVTAYALRREGFNVIAASDGLQALRRWQMDHPDVVVLDANMPKMNGFEVCKRIREQSNTPVILLTALNDEDHIVQGFHIGADDYVTKPFSHRQLAMRIRAVAKRNSSASSVDFSGKLVSGPLSLDRDTHEVLLDGREIHLTPTEFKLLYILVANAGRVVPSSRLVEYAWGYDEGDESLLKTHISHIRRKLGMPNESLGNIVVLPRVGYKFMVPS